jgi:hypothetical protein
MAKRKDYIPAANEQFYDFELVIKNKLLFNAIVWGILPAKAAEFDTKAGDFNILWLAVANKNNRTKGQVETYDAARPVFEKYLRSFCKEFLINNSSISIEDKTTMKLPLGTGGHSPRPAITTAPFVLLKALGGLRIRFECRVEGDSSRPSLHPDCDVVELRGKVGNTPPVNYTECDKDYTSTKANFTVEMPPEFEGKTLYVYARWKNQSDKAKSGPVSSMVMVKIV